MPRRSRYRRGLASLALLAGLLIGCGGPETPSEPPEELLREAAENAPSSGEAAIAVEAELEGDSLLAGDARLELEGPFERPAGGEAPRFDLALDAELAGLGVDGALISTGDDAFVVFFGESYRLGEERFAQLERRLRAAAARGEDFGLDPIGWLEGPRYAGEDEVGGVATERIEATVRGDLVLRDLAELATGVGGLPALDALRGVGGGAAEVWVAYEDRTIRRLRLRFPFTVPAGLRALTGGVSGGALTMDAEVSNLGAEVEIEPPAGGGFQPIDQLLRRLGDLASLGGL